MSALDRRDTVYPFAQRPSMALDTEQTLLEALRTALDELEETRAELHTARAALIRLLGAECVGDLCHKHPPDCWCVHHEARAAIGEKRHDWSEVSRG